MTTFFPILRASWGGAAMACVVASLAAQPVRERRTFSHVMALRHGLWQELRIAEPGRQVEAAELMLDRASGEPITPLANALAKVRGVEADPLFRLRVAMQCLATPEVPDAHAPDSESGVPHFPDVHITMHLPYRIDVPGAVEFALQILDREGQVVWRGKIEQRTELSDLLQFRATTRAPLQELPDGTYRVVAETWVNGEPPRERDSVSSAVFHVRRGFPDFVAGLEERRAALKELAPHSDVALKGAMARLVRVFQGEPVDGVSRVPDDIARAEQMLANAEAGRPVMDGLSGWHSVAVTTGEAEAGRVVLRRAAPTEEAAPAPPLVLVVPGVPTWSPQWDRPMSPRSTAPEWTADLLRSAGFDDERRAHVAVLESPGHYKSAAGAIARAVAELRELLGDVGDVVLVGERESAVAACMAVSRDQGLAQRIVLVSGAVLDRGTAKALRGVSWVLTAGQGEEAVNVHRARDLLEAVGAEVT